MGSSSTIKAEAKKNQLDFLFTLYQKNIKLDDEDIQALKSAGYLRLGIQNSENKKILPDITIGQHHAGNPLLEISQLPFDDSHEVVIHKIAYVETITDKDWRPASITEHTPEFVRWITSINRQGFSQMVTYKPFLLYVEQANRWFSENISVNEAHDDQHREQLEDIEMERCKENSLYFLNKYLKLKEANLSTGARDYTATPAHKVICYLFDCGYPFILGKPRQIAATSTLGGLAIKRMIFHRNYFIKFITQDKLKGEEIFNDKIKHAFSEIPSWLRPEASNDRDNLLKIGKKEEKGVNDGANSRIEVAAPTKTVISGGSPPLAMVDEAGNIKILSNIIADGRTTMYGQDPVTKKIKLLRQMILWGTCGEMDKGGKAFEREFMQAVQDFESGDNAKCMIPLFLDWTTRPGVTQEFYDQEKKIAMDKAARGDEEAMTLFYQWYPSKIEDMFVSGKKTLFTIDWCNQNLKRIVDRREQLMPKFGYFEPVYGNIAQPQESDIPFNIVGVNFVPTETESDPRTAVRIFFEPEPWKYRYYQGTDPIQSDNGLSKMGSSIYDAYYNTISAQVFHRTPNYRYTFLQCMLLGMYYDVGRVDSPKGVQELLECNLGGAYREYKEAKGFGNSLVLNSELPQYLKTSTIRVGIDNKGARNMMIINKMVEMYSAYGKNIYSSLSFDQLKTFTCEISDGGKEVWGPADIRNYRDDILFSDVYAYICRLTYIERTPEPLHAASSGATKKVVYKIGYDKNWNLVRQPVVIKVKKH